MRKNLCCFIILLFSAVIFASDSYGDTTYIVKKGDTLQGISKKFKIPVSNIKEQNNLSSNKLSIGMKLSLSKTQNLASRRSSEGINHISSQSNINPFEVRYHKVKKGDTLEKIAKKYSLSAQRIMDTNGLTTKKLKLGQELLIKSPRPNEHIVKKGDNLWNISVRYGINPEELKEINGLQDNSLKIGQKILLTKKNPANDEIAQSEHLTSQNSKNNSETASLKMDEVRNLSKSDELAELSIRERLIVFAKKMLHLPYRFGGNGPFAIDCSAYVQKVYSFIGLDLPRSAREQFRFGELIDKDELSVGDLVFFRTYASFPSHVGIYLGNNLFIHASSKSKKVTIDSLDTPYYLKRFIGAKKIISEEGFSKVQSENKIN